ncbi:hypothetical protein RU96_GL001306 [Enterococcus canintestini]|uniref:Uncharacterized protein n=1 Tax=Enterococcus canintestini TaxID=317010 RepID=A0A1L8R389_9ENTE|nr:hypothetical protein RU96_GL001306 [Enterococcus canintestini]
MSVCVLHYLALLETISSEKIFKNSSLPLRNLLYYYLLIFNDLN